MTRFHVRSIPGSTVRSIHRAGVMAAAVLAVLTACSDDTEVAGKDGAAPASAASGAKGSIHTGMHLDSVFAVIGNGQFKPTSPADTFRVVHGHRAQVFVTGSHMYRVLFVRKDPGSLDGPIERGNDTPILIEGQNVLGYGWADFDRLSKELSLPVLQTKP